MRRIGTPWPSGRLVGDRHHNEIVRQLCRDHQCWDCNLEESGTNLSGSKQGRLRLIEVEPGLGDREEQAGGQQWESMRCRA